MRSSREPSGGRWVAAAALALGLLALLLPASAVAGKHGSHKPPKAPSGLAFYKPPKHLPKGHGKVIWSRRLKKSGPVPGIRSTKILLYTSKTATGERAAVSGYMAVPRGKPPRRGWPVITWAHGTSGIADRCAPTRGMTDQPPESFVRTWVAAGYAVVATDYQGLGTPGVHQYLIGKSEGRSMLDIISAARRLDSRIGRRFLVAGVSQGGQAALFTASLAKRWKPKLRLRGTVAFAPGSHLAEQAELLPNLTAPSPLSAVAALIFTGALTVNPDLEPSKLISDQALSLMPQVHRRCIIDLSLPDSFGGVAPSTLIRPGADTSELYRVLRSMNPAVRIKGPVLLAQGTADTTVFPFYTDLLETELEAKGDRVDYVKYPGVDHNGIVDAAGADAMAFFQQRLPTSR